MKSQVSIQTTKQQSWVDATGITVPLKFVPAMDKKKEILAGNIYKKALAVEKILQELYELMNEATTEIRMMIKAEHDLKGKSVKDKKRESSITWFSFNKSLKIEADMHDIVKWNPTLMAEAHELLKDFLGKSLNADKEFIGELVMEAFSNSKGVIDSKMIFKLLKYENKLKNAKYSKACQLMREAQDIDKTKMYQRVWEKMEDGSYRNINLNFSSL
ncbi:MAG: hypothetical protein C0459_03265 [Chitinophaga sp.]|jgi:Protein of unknown function (DUF3164)|nr:hypothetical protein [Chitinophaga sp.]